MNKKLSEKIGEIILTTILLILIGALLIFIHWR